MPFGGVVVGRLTAADAWYLYLEGPTVRMHVTALLLLDPSSAPGGFSFAKLRNFVSGRLDLMPALRRRLVEVPFSIDHPSWIEDPDFDLDRHLHHHLLSGTGSTKDLAALVGELASSPLPRDRPLWEMVLVEGLHDGNVALVVKMHHCIVDGISGMEVMAHLADLSPSPKHRRRPADRQPQPVPNAVEVAASAAWNRVRSPLRPVRAAAGVASSLVRMAGTAIRRRLGGTAAVAHPINAPRTRFNATITPDRVVAFGRAPLEDFKTIRRAFGVTVNEVVLAVCTSGLRRYLEAWDRIPDRPLVCSIPVSTHGHGSDRSTNQVSNMFVNLPVHVADPVEQLLLIHQGSLGAKEVQRSVGTDMINDVIELIPAAVFHLATTLYSEVGLADRFAPVHNVVVSNVKGSPVPLYMAGAQVVAIVPFGPLIEGSGLNVTVLSNNEEMNIGLIACPELVPALEDLLDEMLNGITVLLEAIERAV
jgi:diacylglycerol O-acyltransferase / wax synthase